VKILKIMPLKESGNSLVIFTAMQVNISNYKFTYEY